MRNFSGWYIKLEYWIRKIKIARPNGTEDKMVMMRCSHRVMRKRLWVIKILEANSRVPWVVVVVLYVQSYNNKRNENDFPTPLHPFYVDLMCKDSPYYWQYYVDKVFASLSKLLLSIVWIVGEIAWELFLRKSSS